MSLCVSCLCKSRCGRQGRPVGPGAANKSEAVCTAWLIISWKVYGAYTEDGREWRGTRRQRATDERDKEVMRGDSVRGGEKEEGGRKRRVDSKEWINTEPKKVR